MEEKSSKKWMEGYLYYYLNPENLAVGKLEVRYLHL